MAGGGGTGVTLTFSVTGLVVAEPPAFVTVNAYLPASVSCTLLRFSVAVNAEALPATGAPSFRHS